MSALINHSQKGFLMSKAKQDVRMLITVDRPRSGSWEHDGIDATATFVRIEMENGIERVRNIPTPGCFMRAEDLPELADLQVHAYGHLDTDPVFYSTNVEYRNVFSVDLERAKVMAKQLGRVQRGLEQLERELGFSRGFAQKVARVGKILGVTQYGWRVDDGSAGWSYDDHEYRWFDASYLEGYVDGRLRKLREPATV
jgi:hypothetical protein